MFLVVAVILVTRRASSTGFILRCFDCAVETKQVEGYRAPQKMHQLTNKLNAELARMGWPSLLSSFKEKCDLNMTVLSGAGYSISVSKDRLRHRTRTSIYTILLLTSLTCFDSSSFGLSIAFFVWFRSFHVFQEFLLIVVIRWLSSTVRLVMAG